MSSIRKWMTMTFFGVVAALLAFSPCVLNAEPIKLGAMFISSGKMLTITLT